MKKYIVTLTKEEQTELKIITSKGKHRSQKILNALILLGCDEGEFQTTRSINEEISRVLKISMKKIDRVKKTLCRRRVRMYPAASSEYAAYRFHDLIYSNDKY